MNDQELKIETSGNYSPGIVQSDYQITQTIVNQYNNSKRKRWKKLGLFVYPMANLELDMRVAFLRFLLPHFYQAFKNSGYTNFVSIACQTSVPFNNGGSVIGYKLFSQQANFIGILKKSLKKLRDSTVSLEKRKNYQDTLDQIGEYLIKNWELDVEVQFLQYNDTVFPIEFIYDPEEYKIQITTPSVISSDPANYPEKGRTTSEFLTIVAAHQLDEICTIQDYKCIDTFYPLEKFFMAVLDTGAINTGNIRVNVEDCEEYDYINNEYDIEVQSYNGG